MKAYIDPSGKVRLFRPDMNMKRLNRSMKRLLLPEFDGDELTECLKCDSLSLSLSQCDSSQRITRSTSLTVNMLCVTVDNRELLRLDRDWIPEGDGYSLYIRPTGISTQASVGVGASESAKLFIILSPVGPYYPGASSPLRSRPDPSMLT